MSDARATKKSESLEIRLAHSTKQAFMAHCHAEGRSASEAVRGFIDDQLTPRASPPKPRSKGLLIGGLAIAALGAMAAPSLARPAVSAQFRALDANHDGVLTAAEFMKLDANHDGVVSLDEFTKARAGGGPL